jgi:AcrR family transcriptional regulator
VSVNAICQRAGVSKPSLYREFGSEDGLTAAALENYAGMVRGQLLALLSSELAFTAKLEALIAFASEDPRNEHGCLFVKMGAARLDLGPKTRAKIAGIEAAMLEIYAKFFRKTMQTASGQASWLLISQPATCTPKSVSPPPNAPSAPIRPR